MLDKCKVIIILYTKINMQQLSMHIAIKFKIYYISLKALVIRGISYTQAKSI